MFPIDWLSLITNPVLDWTMSGIALAGTLINAERNKWGFAFWFISNLYMTIYFYITNQPAKAVLFFIYFLLAVRGVFSWKSKEEKDKKAIEEAASGAMAESGKAE